MSEEKLVDDKKESSPEGTKSAKNLSLGYYMKEILVGIVISKDHVEYASTVIAKKLHEILPDRIRTIVLTDDDDTSTWPTTNMLIVCCSKPNFPSIKTSNYIQEQQKASAAASEDTKRILVLTDLDLDNNLSDVSLWYQVLEVGGLGYLLPRRATVVSLPSKHSNSNSGNKRAKVGISSDHTVILDRRDQIEINGTILLKPILERSNDPTSTEIRIYYPRSQGGGCKIIQFEDHADDTNKSFSQPKYTSKFDSEIRHVRKKIDKDVTTCWIYEEVAGEVGDDDDDDEGDDKEYDDHGIKRPRERKRDRIKQFVQNLTKSSSIDDLEDLVADGVDVATAKAVKVHGDDDEVSYESDLSRLDRKIYIVTTASLPWMTGTAVNPLLRAAYLKRQKYTSVTLVIPWLERQSDREEVYGTKPGVNFASSDEQEIYVRNWLKNSAHMVEEADPNNGVKIMWYPSRYYSALGSIFPTDDICKQIPDKDADYCILEEPEHVSTLCVCVCVLLDTDSSLRISFHLQTNLIHSPSIVYHLLTVELVPFKRGR